MDLQPPSTEQDRPESTAPSSFGHANVYGINESRLCLPSGHSDGNFFFRFPRRH